MTQERGEKKDNNVRERKYNERERIEER